MITRVVRTLVVALAMLVLVAPRPVQAHGYLVRSIPQDRATLERSPVRVQYWFSEGLEADYSSITIRDGEGNVVGTGGVDPENSSLLTARLPAQLPDGPYLAELRVAFASDGHVVVETRVFFVGEQVAGVDGAAAADTAVPLEVVWRVMILASFLLLFGAFALYSSVLVPAWGNRRYRAGLLPPRVMSRLTAIAAAALGLAFIGSIVALLQQAMVFFNADLGRVIEQGLWSTVRAGSRFGDVWNARVLLLLIAAGLVWGGHYFRERQPESVRAFWTAGTWVTALLLGSLSVASHAAGSPVWPWAAIIVDWAHTLAVGFWVGALAALVLVLPAALRPYQADARRAALLAALQRFSPLAVASLVVVVATGIYSAANWVREPAQVSGTYGLTLGLKLALVLALVALGAVHHAALRPERYARWSGVASRARGFLPTLRWEAVAALAVLVAAAVLSATPVPRPSNLDSVAPHPSTVTTLGDLTVTAELSPGGPGVNSYDVVVRRDGAPVDDLDVRVQFADPERDWRGPWQHAESVGDGLYTTTGDDLDRVGNWWMLLSIDGTETALAWTIRDDPAALAVFQPTLLQAIALLGVIGSFGLAALPKARRFYSRLDLRPATVTVAVGAIAAGIAIVIGGFALMDASDAQYQAMTNPPPARVNPTLPDLDSVRRGADAFAASCVGWAEQETMLNSLVSRLSGLRDEDLFALLDSGWRTLPPCGGALSDAERWDIVNYVRTLELQAARANRTEDTGL